MFTLVAEIIDGTVPDLVRVCDVSVSRTGPVR